MFPQPVGVSEHGGSPRKHALRAVFWFYSLREDSFHVQQKQACVSHRTGANSLNTSNMLSHKVPYSVLKLF